jgi:hypothetical protein
MYESTAWAESGNKNKNTTHLFIFRNLVIFFQIQIEELQAKYMYFNS